MWAYFRPTPTTRRDIVFSITALGLLAALFLTPALWYSPDRLFPLVPVIPGFSLPPLVHGILYALSSIGLGVALVLPTLRQRATTIALGSLGILVLLDITRLQPWLLHYGAILLVFIIVWYRHHSPSQLLEYLRLIIAAIYFWSGLQKLNVRFIGEIFPWFTEPLWSPLGDTGAYLAISIAFFVPWLEAAIGLGLLTRRWRNPALIGAGLMLVLVLASIGPFGHNWNSSVWPWNIALFASAVALFWRTQGSATELWRRNRTSLIAWVLILVFWLYPIGNWFGVSDYYLSWSLYSGRAPEAELIADATVLQAFYPALQTDSLHLQIWSVTELNVPPYPEITVFTRWFDTLCDTYPQTNFRLKLHSHTTADTSRMLECG